MSNYLTNFYCGNKRNLCNYNEPIEYKKLLNRQFNNNLHYYIEDCNNIKNSSLGYCCDSKNPEMLKNIDMEYMDKMNR